MVEWTARAADGTVIAVEKMRRVAVTTGKLSGQAFSIERDGRLVTTYKASKVAVPTTATKARPAPVTRTARGTIFVACPRCHRSVRPLRSDATRPAGHVRTGTRTICKEA